jgi:hypothetical protein
VLINFRSSSCSSSSMSSLFPSSSSSSSSVDRSITSPRAVKAVEAEGGAKGSRIRETRCLCVDAQRLFDFFEA